MSPTLRMVVCKDPALLLQRAAEAFLHPPTGEEQFPSPPVLLVLRQGGLRDDLYSLAAERGVAGWFDPPISVFHELPQWLGATALRPLGDFERAALLEHLLRTHGGDVFKGREGVFLSSVERLFGELRADAVAPATLEGATAALGAREEFEVRRDAAIAAVYRAYVTVLEEQGLRDGRDTLADCAAALSADREALIAAMPPGAAGPSPRVITLASIEARRARLRRGGSGLSMGRV